MADESYDDQFDRIANNLYKLIDTKSDEALQKKMKLLDKRLTDLQRTFFTVLSQKIIGVFSAPQLGGFTPRWKSLSTVSSYRNKKIKEGRDPRAFYTFKGGLQRSLMMSKATNAFGNPAITLGTGGTYRNQPVYQSPKTKNGIIPSGKPFSLDKLKTAKIKKSISVNLFPKVRENLKGPIGSYFEGDYLSDKIAIKLTNFRGRRERPILIPFMNWWINVKAMEVIRRTI